MNWKQGSEMDFSLHLITFVVVLGSRVEVSWT
jgi:hypothetical protein